jgi:hypothetical protein
VSATSPTITIETRGANPSAQLCDAIARLYFRRLVWRAAAGVAFTLFAVLALFGIAGAADCLWPLSRAARRLFLLTTLATALLSLARAVWPLIRQRSLRERAREIERAAGLKQNVLVTFAENATFAESATDAAGIQAQPQYIMARLYGQARIEFSRIDERTVAPRRWAARGALALALVFLVMLALRLIAPAALAREQARLLWLQPDGLDTRRSEAGKSTTGGEASSNIVVDELRVRILPPAYSGLSIEEVTATDAPLRVLAGSQIEISLRARGPIDGATLGFNGSVNRMRALGEERFTGAFTASVSGAFEMRVLADERVAPAPYVRAVETYADAVPLVRITEPAGDQLLRAVPGGPIGVRWTARDDLGLASVALKYIKSRGEGDAAKFTSGELSTGTIARASTREWQGAGALDLARLDVRAGDTLVFWVEARDHNPSPANTGRSASLAIAIAGPEGIKLNLSDLRPSEIGRFLLSQRQIIINTEKLHNERSRLTADELKRRANAIAADQREFKNSFNDYIRLEGPGAHDEGMAAGAASSESVEEQAQEAVNERIEPHDHGIPEPPQGSPSSVRDMVYAIRAMWDAEDALSLADTAKALVHEREALMRLKRAQLAARYVPPIVAQSKPIDLKRRYAGELAEIKTRLEKLSRRAASKESGALRAALADAYAALADLQGTLDVPVTARASATARARERARSAADRLASIGGDHAATVAEATGQLRIVETELGRMETGGAAEEYAARLGKPLALLTQAASNLFAIADLTTRANSGDANLSLPADERRAARYFRRLAAGSTP